MSFDRTAAISVACAATLSFVSCVSIGVYVAYLSIRYRGIATENVSTKSGIRFLRTQAGTLFLNLLAADCMQALGFGLSWVWAGHGSIYAGTGACTLQAIAIEAGDVASAIFSFFIAIHTAAFLGFAYKPPTAAVKVACVAAWCFTTFITSIGPLAIQKVHLGQFYGLAGSWCWISSNYDTQRLWLHYSFLFASAIGQLFAYCAIFSILRFRTAVERRVDRLTPSNSFNDLRSHKAELTKPQGGYVPPVRPSTAQSRLRTKIDRSALVMLAYPLVNLSVILPLSIYRLAALSGHTWSTQAMAACGTIFALGGFANSLLYSFTRRLLRLSTSQDTIVSMPPPSELKGTGKHGFAAYSVSAYTFATPSSGRTRVDSPLPSPITSVASAKLKELRLSPGSSRSQVLSASGLLPSVHISSMTGSLHSGTPLLTRTRSQSSVTTGSAELNRHLDFRVRIEDVDTFDIANGRDAYPAHNLGKAPFDRSFV